MLGEEAAIEMDGREEGRNTNEEREREGRKGKKWDSWLVGL